MGTTMTHSMSRHFDFEATSFTTIIDADGNPWWLASDICRMIGLDNVSQALSRLEEDEIDNITQIDAIGRDHAVKIVNESGLYNLTIRSDKPEAKRFRHFITREVLPALRKYGRFDDVMARYAPDVVELIEADKSVIQLQKLLDLTREQVGQRARLEVIEHQQRELLSDLAATANVAYQAHTIACEVQSSYIGRTGFKTALGYSLTKGYKIERKDLATIGRKLSTFCKTEGIGRQEVEDEHYGRVQAYPLEVLDKHEALFKQHDAFKLREPALATI
jgi:prophage antirepressor-like protein